MEIPNTDFYSFVGCVLFTSFRNFLDIVYKRTGPCPLPKGPAEGTPGLG